MSNSLNLELPYLAAAQSQKHVTVNESLRRLDAAIQLSVIDQTHTEPPGSPSEGDRYIVAVNATGVWDGQTYNVAAYVDGAWIFFQPKQGWLAYISDEHALYVFNGASWQLVTELAGFDTTSQLGINASADSNNRLVVKAAASLFEADNGGGTTGDVRVVLSKSGITDTASHLFQNSFSGRAEIGLIGSDDFSVKVSPDGSSFYEAMKVAVADGSVDFLQLPTVGGISILSAGVRSRLHAQSIMLPDDVEVIDVRGYSSQNDGGGARYKHVNNEPSHAAKFQSGDGRWWEIDELEVKAEHFGGGPSATDNSAAMQAAFDVGVALGRAVRVGGGRYSFTAPITVPSGLTLLGTGRAGASVPPVGAESEFRFAMNGTAGVLSATDDNLTNVMMRDISFSTEADAELDAVMNLTHIRSCTFDNVRIRHNNETYPGGALVTIEQQGVDKNNWVNFFSHCHFTADGPTHNVDMSISDSFFSGCYFGGGLGCRVRMAGGIQFSGCHFDDADKPGGAALTLASYDASIARFGCRVAGCYFDLSETGIAIDGAAYSGGTAFSTTQIVGCNFRSNGHHMKFMDGSGCVVVGNTFGTPNTDHMSFTNWNDAQIFGNTYESGTPVDRLAQDIDIKKQKANLHIGSGGNAGPHKINFYKGNDSVGMSFTYSTALNSLELRDAQGNPVLTATQAQDVAIGNDLTVTGISTGGTMRVPKATAATLADASDALNTANKAAGNLIYETTNNRLMVADGSSATAKWFVSDGSASVTPA